MPDWTWLLLHAVQNGALLACALFAAHGSRRVGSQTPYGAFLFVLALGFWFLLVGDLLFMVRVVTGAWRGPPTVADVLQLAGWILLASSFFLFALRFPRVGPPGSRRALLVAGGLAAAPMVALLALFRLVLSPPGADPAADVRAAYLLVDGLALGGIAASTQGLLRLRESALSRLYLLLGLALLVKIAGDVGWAYLAARGMTSLLATATYPLAGVLTVLALGLHARVLHQEGARRDRFADPTLRQEQRVIRDVVGQLRGLVGAFAAETALRAAEGALAARGIPHRVLDDVLQADAPGEAWVEVLEAMRDGVLAVMGEAARAPLVSVARAYGPEYGFIAGEAPA